MPELLSIDEPEISAAVLGGAILGGGGGGWIEEGEKLGRAAWEMGFRGLTPIDALSDEALLLTVSLVGAPSMGRASVTPADYIRAVEFFIEHTGMPIAGLISSEIGAVGVVNGWVQSAALGIPVVDAPCNGRAHPLGLMGSMGLHRVDNYVSRQTAVGSGSGGAGKRVEDFHEGTIEAAARKVLQSAVKAGGMVAVARNPVTAAYVRHHGALAAVRRAFELGATALRVRKEGAENMAKEILKSLKGTLLSRGVIQRRRLQTVEGLDIGALDVETEDESLSITFWNEYMTLERGGERVARFPDLIVAFDAETTLPVPSAETRDGQEVLVIAVPSDRITLGAGCRDPELLGRVDKTLETLRN